VENIGYLDICKSENIMVERAHFQKIFEIYSKRQQTEQRLPAPLLKAIGAMRTNDGFLKIGSGEN
jgi:hypothetical protein